uniref:Putative secreted protein n=1 Tax=Anopheles darlingi TaxID=43151 RepID=A0A2M4DJU5_ANODA
MVKWRLVLLCVFRFRSQRILGLQKELPPSLSKTVKFYRLATVEMPKFIWKSSIHGILGNLLCYAANLAKQATQEASECVLRPRTGI